MSLSSEHLRGILSMSRPLSVGDYKRIRSDVRRHYSDPKNSLRHIVLGPGEKFELGDLIRDAQERLKPSPQVEYRPARPNNHLYFIGSILTVGGLLAALLAGIGWLLP